MTAKEPRTQEPSPEVAKSDPLQAELADLRGQLEDRAPLDPVMKLQLIVRSEMALLHIRVQRAAGRTTLFIVGMVFALFALLLLNFAAFYAMLQAQGPIWAALYMALIDSAVAVVVMLAARKVGPRESQEKLALEVRELAYADLTRDIGQLQTELENTVSEVQELRSSAQSVRSLLGAVGKLTSGN